MCSGAPHRSGTRSCFGNRQMRRRACDHVYTTTYDSVYDRDRSHTEVPATVWQLNDNRSTDDREGEMPRRLGGWRFQPALRRWRAVTNQNSRSRAGVGVGVVVSVRATVKLCCNWDTDQRPLISPSTHFPLECPPVPGVRMPSESGIGRYGTSHCSILDPLGQLTL